MVVVTGATGHLGNNLVRQLVSNGHTVRCVVLPEDQISSLKPLGVEILRGDVRDVESLVSAFRGAEVVYHLASVICLMPREQLTMEEVNVQGTRNVVEACLRTGVRRLVYTSSVHALVEPPPGSVLDEGMSVDPSRVPMAYGRSKARATLQVLAGVQKGLDAVVLLPTGMIGPYDYRPSEMGRFILAFAQGRLPFRVCGGYDFVDVRDVALGHILAAQKGHKGAMYLLSGEWISIDTLISYLEQLTGKRAPSLILKPSSARTLAAMITACSALAGKKPLFTLDAVNTLLSNSGVSSQKARAELGYCPRPLTHTLRDTVEWFQEQGWL